MSHSTYKIDHFDFFPTIIYCPVIKKQNPTDEKHTHTAVLQSFVRDYLGWPVPKETFTHSHVKWESVIILYCMQHEEDNRGKCADNPDRRHRIWTIDAPTSIIPQFHAGCPSCRNTPNLSWLRTGTKYAGLHTWRLR